MNKNEKTTEMSLRWWASQLARDERTLARRFRAAGLDVARKKSYTPRQVYDALLGSIEAERVREKREHANLLELECQKRKRELIPTQEALDLIRDCFQPLRQAMLELPAAICARVNPIDPDLARQTLDLHVTELLDLVRGKIPIS
jgi:hypothetical protein